MLDIQLLRSDLPSVAKRLADRGTALDFSVFERLESERKSVQTQTQELQAKRNQLSKQIGQAKAKGQDAAALMVEVNAQAGQLKLLEQQLAAIQDKLNDFLTGIPNIPHPSVPAGRSADDNQELRKWGAKLASSIVSSRIKQRDDVALLHFLRLRSFSKKIQK